MLYVTLREKYSSNLQSQVLNLDMNLKSNEFLSGTILLRTTFVETKPSSLLPPPLSIFSGEILRKDYFVGRPRDLSFLSGKFLSEEFSREILSTKLFIPKTFLKWKSQIRPLLWGQWFFTKVNNSPWDTFKGNFLYDELSRIELSAAHYTIRDNSNQISTQFAQKTIYYRTISYRDTVFTTFSSHFYSKTLSKLISSIETTHSGDSYSRDSFLATYFLGLLNGTKLQAWIGLSRYNSLNR